MTDQQNCISVRTKVHLWWTWLHIAACSTSAAKTARLGEALVNSFESHESAMLSTEFRQSLVAIAAVAFSIEAISKELTSNRYELDESKYQMPAKTNAGFFIGHRIVQAFGLRGEFANHLPAELEAIFRLRNDSVHFESEYRDGAHPHPSGTNAAYELTLYTLEQATHSLKLGLQILRSCAESANNKVYDASAKHIVQEMPGVLHMFEEVLKNKDLGEVL